MIQFDVIGIGFSEPVLAEDECLVTPAQPLPGWRVNATARVPGWDQWLSSDAPLREFSGAQTVCYVFSDPETYANALAGYLASAGQVSKFDRDQARYQRRAAVKDEMIAWMAADNMSRVRSGVWSVADLQALLVDLGAVNGMMQTLSYEQAAQAIATAGNPLMTAEIKAAWVAKLTEHFYLGA